MIKLIVSDMDGTFLDDKNKMHELSIETIKELHKKGIIFACASGRQYDGLKRMFEEVKDLIYFIPENGSLAVYNDKEIFSDILEKKYVEKILKSCANIDPFNVFLCSKNYLYTNNKESYDFVVGEGFLYSAKLVENLHDVDDDILKISVMERNNDYQCYNYLANEFSDNLDCIISGMRWFDLSNKNINKGNTLKQIQKLLDISPSETLVFGDSFNDLSMFAQSEFSYAMKHSHDDVKKYAKYILEDNNNGGVIKKIIEITKDL